MIQYQESVFPGQTIKKECVNYTLKKEEWLYFVLFLNGYFFKKGLTVKETKWKEIFILLNIEIKVQLT